MICKCYGYTELSTLNDEDPWEKCVHNDFRSSLDSVTCSLATHRGDRTCDGREYSGDVRGPSLHSDSTLTTIETFCISRRCSIPTSVTLLHSTVTPHTITACLLHWCVVGGDSINGHETSAHRGQEAFARGTRSRIIRVAHRHGHQCRHRLFHDLLPKAATTVIWLQTVLGYVTSHLERSTFGATA